MSTKETKKMDRIQKMEAFVTKLKQQEIEKQARNMKTNEKLKKFQQLREFKEDEKSDSGSDSQQSDGSSSSIDSEQERILMKKLAKRQEKKKQQKQEVQKNKVSGNKDDINNLYKDIQKEKRKEVEFERQQLSKRHEILQGARKASAVAPQDSGESSGEQNTKPVQRIKPSRHRMQQEAERQKIAESMEARKTAQIIEEFFIESTQTVLWYFANLISLLLIMLVYYGLIVILLIAVMIQLYDYNYNHEEFVKAAYPTLNSEFRSQEEIQAQENADHAAHEGHHHFKMPLDWTNVQSSVWFALVPATMLIWLNLKVLKMEHVDEYRYFKAVEGMRQMNMMKLFCLFCWISYIVLIIVNYRSLFNSPTHHIYIWQNFEGLLMYTLLAISSATLHEYGKSKLKDFIRIVEERRKYTKKQN